MAQRKSKPELKIVVSNTPEALAVEVVPEQVEMPFAIVNGEPLTQMPKDLYIPPQAMEVFLEAFEGPLDLLLYLIRRQNLNILDIPLAEITRQYMKYIEVMTELQLELAGEYMVMAATLAEIKSRMLLPRPKVDAEGQEDDPRAELVRRLQEYERFKRAAEDIDALPRLERDVWTTSADLKDRKVVKLLPTITLQEMLIAFKDVVVRSEMFAHHHIQRERLSVRARMSEVLTTLEHSSFIEFVRLFRVEEGRMGVTVTFMAILELVREGLVEIVQAEPFAPIHVRAAGASRKLHVVASNETLAAPGALVDGSAVVVGEAVVGDAPGVGVVPFHDPYKMEGFTELVLDPNFVDDSEEDLEAGPLEGVDDVVGFAPSAPEVPAVPSAPEADAAPGDATPADGEAVAGAPTVALTDDGVVAGAEPVVDAAVTGEPIVALSGDADVASAEQTGGLAERAGTSAAEPIVALAADAGAVAAEPGVALAADAGAVAAEPVVALAEDDGVVAGGPTVALAEGADALVEATDTAASEPTFALAEAVVVADPTIAQATDSGAGADSTIPQATDSAAAADSTIPLGFDASAAADSTIPQTADAGAAAVDLTVAQPADFGLAAIEPIVGLAEGVEVATLEPTVVQAEDAIVAAEPLPTAESVATAVDSIMAGEPAPAVSLAPPDAGAAAAGDGVTVASSESPNPMAVVAEPLPTAETVAVAVESILAGAAAPVVESPAELEVAGEVVESEPMIGQIDVPTESVHSLPEAPIEFSAVGTQGDVGAEPPTSAPPTEEGVVTVDPAVFDPPTATVEAEPPSGAPPDEPSQVDVEYAGPDDPITSGEQPPPDDDVSLIGETPVAGEVSLVGDDSLSGGPAVEVEEFAFDELPALDETPRVDEQPAVDAQPVVKNIVGTDEPPSPGEESDD